MNGALCKCDCIVCITLPRPITVIELRDACCYSGAMSKHEEADLILKLYDLRREQRMREARTWFAREFNPQTSADVNDTMFGPNGEYLRMVMSYWDMAAALVNHGAISEELFDETNTEHLMVYGKLEPLLGEMRAMYGPQVLLNLEKLFENTKGLRERVASWRERWNGVRAEMERRRAVPVS